MADGGWSLAAGELEGLRLFLPADASGTLALTLRATAHEANGDTASREADFTVQVAAVSDGALLTADGAGDEDSWIPLLGSLLLRDTDGSERFDDTLLVSGLPPGAVLSHSAAVSPGVWQVPLVVFQAGALAVLPPADSNADLQLRFSVTTIDSGGGAEDRAVTTADVTVVVRAVADAPLLTVAELRGTEDVPLRLAGLGATLRDTDGSETLGFVLAGLPAGAGLSAGTRQADGSWRLTAAELAAASLNPPPQFSGRFELTLTAIATEAGDDKPVAATTARFSVSLDPVADAGSIGGGSSGAEDSAILLRPVFATPDTDGSEQWGATSQVGGVPAGATLSQGRPIAAGVWEVATAALLAGEVSITPQADSDVDITLSITSQLTDSGNDIAVSRSIVGRYVVGVTAVADAPLVTVADLRGSEDTALRLAGLGGALRDTDGSETLGFQLSGLPPGASLTAGVKQPDGSWLLTPAQLSAASLNPPAQFSGSFALTLTAIATEGADGRPTARSSAAFSVSLDPVADSGSIGGKVTGREDSAIILRPSFTTPDADGSEIWAATSRIAGIPAAAALSQGDRLADGSWVVSTAALRAGQISLTPPADSDIDLTLRITTTLSDTGNGKTVSRSIDGNYTVAITAVADAPIATAQDASGPEDQPIALDLAAALRDTDGSETLTLNLLDVPRGASLSRGSLNADGSWSLTAADLPGLTLTPPRDASGSFTLRLRAVAADRDNSSATTTATFTLRVEAVADAPVLRTAGAIGAEDGAIALHASAFTTDRDGSETIVSFRLAGVPAGAVVRAGGAVLAAAADGSVLVAASAMGTLSITPPPQSDQDFTLQVTAISGEPNGSRAESPPRDLLVQVLPVADAPRITGSGGTGQEDGAVALDLGAALVDTDGSEALTVLVGGLPAGARLTAGTWRGDGQWALTAAEARQVSLLPPPDFAGTFSLRVTAVAQEARGGSASTTALLPVTVLAMVDAPAVGGLDGRSGDWGSRSGLEDRPVALRLDPGLGDRDGSDQVVGTVVLGGIPTGAVLQLADGSAVGPDADGLWRIDATRMAGVTLTPPPDSSDAITLSVRMTLEDSGGVQQEIGGHLMVQPRGVADAPLLVVRDAAGAAGDWLPLPQQVAVRDADGSETLALWVHDLPAGFQLSAGHPAGDGGWLVPAAGLPGLTIRAPDGFDGLVTLRLQAVATERDGDHAATAGSLTLRITPPAGDGTGGGGAGGGGTGNDGDAAAAAPPLLVATADAGTEDQAVALRLSLATGATDGRAERLSLRLEGVPEGARLSAGMRDPESGAWIVVPAALAGLTLTPPADFSGEIPLRLRALAVQPDGSMTTTEQALVLAVAPVTDAAVISMQPATAWEDTPVALNLAVAPRDTDGSESLLSVVLSGLPAGAAIAAGPGIAALGGGRWSVDPAALGELRLVPPPQFSGPLSLTVAAVTREAAGGSRTTTAVLSLTVAPLADPPQLAVQDAAGLEDAAVPLALSATLADRDGSETLSLVLEGLPEGSRLSAGLSNGDGSWTLTPAQLDGLQLLPPAHWSGSMALTLVAHAMEGADAGTASSRAPFRVTIGAVADTPLLEVPASLSGPEDGVLALNLRGRLVDGDGSETLALRVTGVPAGAGFTAGTDHGDGSWSIPGDAVAALGFRPPPDASGSFRLSFTAIATEAAGGSAAGPAQEMSITILPVTDTPLLALAAAPGVEDMPLPLSIAAAAADADGSESLSRVLVHGVPAAARLSAGSRQADGAWLLLPAQLAGLTLTPPPQFSGSLTLSVTAVVAELASGVEASTTGMLRLEVAPVADAPLLTVAAASGTEDTALALPISAGLADTDGSERLVELRITGLPAGFALSAGQAAADGAWSLAPAELTGLRLLPAADWNGTLRLTVQASSEEIANGASATTSRDVTVTLTAVNDAPVLEVAPAASAPAGASQAEVLTQASAHDTDSAWMGGAVVTLGGGRGGDRLGFDGYALHDAGGHLMVGDTGIEVRGGGFDATTGQLVLQGAASPATYAAVLQSLVLENTAPGGLAAGAREVAVLLRDSAGAEADRQSVTVTVEAPVQPAPEVLPEAPAALAWTDPGLEHGAVAAGSWIDPAQAGDALLALHHEPPPGLPEPGLPESHYLHT